VPASRLRETWILGVSSEHGGDDLAGNVVAQENAGGTWFGVHQVQHHVDGQR